MVRTPSGSLGTKFTQETLELARLWTLTLSNGTVHRFTDSDEDIVVGSDTFRAAVGFEASSMITSINNSTQGLEMRMIADATIGVSAQEIRDGALDQAQGVLQVVDWSEPNNGTMTLFGGQVGEISVDEQGDVRLRMVGRFTDTRTIRVERFSASCRVQLGDSRCGYDLDAGSGPVKVTGTVTGVTNNFTFADTTNVTQADEHWTLGAVQWTSGANNGLSSEVRTSSQSGNSVSTFLPFPFDIQVGDGFTLFPGCDKQLSTCRDRFDNVVNFRGEPFVPGAALVQ